MKSPAFSTPLIVSFGLAIITIAAIVMGQLITIPKLSGTRKELDTTRANIILTQRRQTNIQTVKRDIESLREQGATLNKELWSFRDEDAFFSFWDGLATKQRATIDVPTIADAIPGEQPIERAAIVTVTGTLDNIMNILNETQKHQPLIVISSVAIGPGTDSKSTVAVITTRTLWK